jgi:uncharacterized membrane protein YfcA
VLGPGWTEIAALGAAFAIAVLATPAGVSGAVLLLPFQVGVLGTPSPAVTPTNLLYNVVATPGALYRYWRQHQTGGSLAVTLITGTVPGVIAGSVIRVEFLPGPRVFDLVIAAVLIPLGAYLSLSVPQYSDQRPPDSGAPRHGRPGGGGLRRRHGIGGGSILAPILIGTGALPARVGALARIDVRHPAAGVCTFVILSLHQHGAVAPDWPTGLALGAGGLAGSYWGARLQSRLPDILIRRLLGVLVIAIGARYLWSGLA